MKGLGHRNGAFGLIVEMAIPTNDRVCWFGDGVSCASDFHLRFYGRFATCISCMRCMRDCPAHARKVNGLMVKIASAVIAKECNVRKEAELFL